MGEQSGLFGGIAPIVIMVVFLVAVIIVVWKTVKESKFRKYLAELMESAKSLYFCGSSLERIIKTRTLIRVQDWVDADMCRWWACDATSKRQSDGDAVSRYTVRQ